MIIIADSGSSKTDWRLIYNNGNIASVQTIGVNPYFISNEQLREIVNKEITPLITETIESVYFYAAGISSKQKKDELTQGLKTALQTENIAVESDMIAAVRATCGKNGIVCILGTGSNSCVVENNTISEQIPALGFILGDEGSGAYLGKQFLTAYFYNELPYHIANDFKTQFQLSDDAIFNAVYKRPFPNKFLASLAPFIHQYKEEPILKKMILQAFQAFSNKHILPYKRTDFPVSFVGSIAFYFKYELLQVCKNDDLMIGCIIHKPIDELVKFHLSK